MDIHDYSDFYRAIDLKINGVSFQESDIWKTMTSSGLTKYFIIRGRVKMLCSVLCFVLAPVLILSDVFHVMSAFSHEARMILRDHCIPLWLLYSLHLLVFGYILFHNRITADAGYNETALNDIRLNVIESYNRFREHEFRYADILTDPYAIELREAILHDYHELPNPMINRMLNSEEVDPLQLALVAHETPDFIRLMRNITRYITLKPKS